jgi:hypothetical protein
VVRIVHINAVISNVMKTDYQGNFVGLSVLSFLWIEDTKDSRHQKIVQRGSLDNILLSPPSIPILISSSCKIS